MSAVLFFDREDGAVLVSPTANKVSGLVGQISLSRLCELMERAGETKPGERITALSFDRDGMMQFQVKS